MKEGQDQTYFFIPFQFLNASRTVLNRHMNITYLFDVKYQVEVNAIEKHGQSLNQFLITPCSLRKQFIDSKKNLSTEDSLSPKHCIHDLCIISKIQLVLSFQCWVLIG